MKTEDCHHIAMLACMLTDIVNASPGRDKGPNRIAKDALDLNTLASRARSNAENLCNLRNYQDKHDKKAETLKRKAAEILMPYGLCANVHGDPRGSCFRIRMENCPKDFGQVPDAYRPFYASSDGEDGFRL